MFFGVISPRSVFADLHAAPAVAQRDRHGALGGGLADDVLVQLLDDLARGHRRHVRRRAARASVSIAVAVRVDADVGRDAERLLDDRPRVELGVLRAARAPRPARTRRRNPRPSGRARARSRRRCRRPRTTASGPRRTAAPRAGAGCDPMRQSLASSIAARVRLPYCCSFASKRSNSVNASAVPPAKPAITLALVQPAHLARIALHDGVAERHLAVAAHGDETVAAHAEDGRAVGVETAHVDRTCSFRPSRLQTRARHRRSGGARAGAQRRTRGPGAGSRGACRPASC